MRNLHKNLLGSAVAALFLILPNSADAAGWFVTCNGLDCNFCDGIQMINFILQWVVRISIMLGGVLLVVAGFRLVTSGGDEKQYKRAKEMLFSAIIGFIIVLAAWTIIDTLLKLLATDDTQEMVFGVWNDVQCGGMTNQDTNMPDAIDIDDTELPPNFYGDNEGEPTDDWTGDQYLDAGMQIIPCNVNEAAPMGGCAQWCLANYPTSVFRTGQQLGPQFGDAPYCVVPPAITCQGQLVNGVCQPTTADPTADGSFDYQPGIAAQRAHASPALSALLDCMARTVPGNVGIISSISDSLIVNGQFTWQQCAVTGMCAHAQNSYHYGGAQCTGRSYAVDFGDEQNVGVLCAAARSCNPSTRDCSVHNGNHVHVDIPISC